MKHKDTESVRFSIMDINKLHITVLSRGVASLEQCFDNDDLIAKLLWLSCVKLGPCCPITVDNISVRLLAEATICACM